MSAGRRNQLVTLQSFTTTQDEYNEDTQDWADLGKEWAAVLYGSGGERRQAAVEQGQQAATFQMLANLRTLTIGVKDRIVHSSANWDITGVAPDTPRPGEIEFTATRVL